MKQIFCAVSLLFLIGGAAWAQEEQAGPEVNASLKAWLNEWKHDAPGTGRSLSDNVVFLAGTAVGVEFRNHMVLEASYLFSTSDYKFTESGITTRFERRDLELGLGKRFNRYAEFLFGYRNSSFRNAESKEYSYGLFYSLRGNLPLKGESGLYGNVTWFDTRFKAEGLAREEAPGWITEIGGKTVFTQHLALKVGYKWETMRGKDSGIEDSFRGTTFELVYAF